MAARIGENVKCAIAMGPVWGLGVFACTYLITWHKVCDVADEIAKYGFKINIMYQKNKNCENKYSTHSPI